MKIDALKCRTGFLHADECMAYVEQMKEGRGLVQNSIK
jgi:hypothetical protein